MQSAQLHLNYLQASVLAFRVGLEADGNDNLVKFIESFWPVLETGKLQATKRLAGWLEEIVAAQARHDYLWVADLLEYEITPLLEKA